MEKAMTGKAPSSESPSEVAMWHKLSGLPDNVTDDGLFVDADAGRRARTEKAQLRAAITALSAADLPDAVRSRARLAASYLLAGDAETARRYVAAARELLAEPGTRKNTTSYTSSEHPERSILV